MELIFGQEKARGKTPGGKVWSDVFVQVNGDIPYGSPISIPVIR